MINYELPEIPEIYVHRIGRTGRAGATGIALSFCSRDERCRLQLIERLTRQTILVEHDHPEYSEPPNLSSHATPVIRERPVTKDRPTRSGRPAQHADHRIPAPAGRLRKRKRERRGTW